MRFPYRVVVDTQSRRQLVLINSTSWERAHCVYCALVRKYGGCDYLITLEELQADGTYEVRYITGLCGTDVNDPLPNRCNAVRFRIADHNN